MTTPAEQRAGEGGHQAPTDARRDVGVVLVAAGASTRTGAERHGELKQFRWVAGKPMLLHSLQAFHRRADVALVVCVLPRHTVGDPPAWIFQCDVDRLLISVGGRHRGESVRNGLEDLPGEVEIVLVHDAARPLVDDTVVSQVIAAARTGVGAVPALRVVDTVKEVDDGGRIARTLDRTRLWTAQTPQAFPREMIQRAHVAAAREGRSATDDAALCEHFGLPVVVVPGSERTIKVTWETDFARVDALAALPA